MLMVQAQSELPPPRVLMVKTTYSHCIFDWPCYPVLMAGRCCTANGVIPVTTSVVKWARKQPLRLKFNQSEYFEREQV